MITPKKEQELSASLLNKDEATSALASQGFIVNESRLDIGRGRISGPVTKDSRTYFLKLCQASSPTASRFQNEVTFYNQFSQLNFPEFVHPVLTQPPQEIRGYFFFLREYFPQETALGTHHSILSPKYFDQITKIITLIHFLQNQKLDLLPIAEEHLASNKNNKSKIVAAATRYAKDVRRIDPDPLIDIIVKTQFIENQALATSEIVPWHLFISPQGLTFIDTEWASQHYPLHYDIALSFCRTFAYYPQDPSAAISLLHEYINTYHGQEPKDRFLEHLRGLIALRTIGQLRDISLSREPDSHFDELVKLSTSGKLFNYL